MSYDIYLQDEDKGVHMFDEIHTLQGGTYSLGGTYDASLNITWNYAKMFYRVFEGELGIRTLYGKTAKESIPILDAVIIQLGKDTHPDYWVATEGNARKALENLRELAVLAGVSPCKWAGD